MGSARYRQAAGVDPCLRRYVVVWAATGPIFHFSDTWQLVINTGTTIVTFLMVFLIQNSQNRDTEALQIKLDELIRAFKPARQFIARSRGARRKGSRRAARRATARSPRRRAGLKERVE